MPRNRSSLASGLATFAGAALLVAGSFVASPGTAGASGISVIKIGSGAGSIVADKGLIDCGPNCSDTLAEGTPVTFTATPDGDSQFVGWLGPCTGSGSCSFIVAGDTAVVGGFAPKSLGVPRLDIDGTGNFDSRTDGILTIRYLFGLTGQALITGAIGGGATRATAGQVSDYLENIRPTLDVDGNGRVDGLTDGLLVARFLQGMRGASLIAGAVAPDATRTSVDAIEVQLVALTGLSQTVSFQSTPPTDAIVNGPGYAVLASATSGLPVALSIDPVAATVCSIAASVVSFDGPGTCVVNADQSGSDVYGPAPTAQQAFSIRSTTDNTYFTAFQNTENPLSEGGRWTNGKTIGLDWNDARSTAGKAYGSAIAAGYNDDIAVLTGAFPANQYAQGTVFREAGYSPGVSHEVELLLRFQITPHSARGYEVLWTHTGYLNIVRWNGPLGDYTPLGPVQGVFIGPPIDGDVLRAEIADNVIKVYRNGTLVMTGPPNSTWTDGQPGIGFWPTPGSTPENYGWKSFEAGPL